MYYINRKKEIIKNVVYLSLIFIIAIVSTYYIYNEFQENRNTDFNSDSLVVTYHESTRDKITIKKVIPVTDSVGLSSKAYNISIKNNLTEKVSYKVQILDDLEAIKEDECEDNLLEKEDIHISVKKDKNENKIYTLSDLEDGVLFSDYINALDTDNISIRIWVSKDSSLPYGAFMHYHGIIQIVESDGIIAINTEEDTDE